MLRVFLTLFVFVIPAASYSYTTWLTGEQYYRMCNDENKVNKKYKNFCYGYAAASFSSYLGTVSAINGVKYANCYDRHRFEGVTAGQLNDMFIQWLKKNPKHRNWDSSCLFENAMARNYPAVAECKKFVTENDHAVTPGCKMIFPDD